MISLLAAFVVAAAQEEQADFYPQDALSTVSASVTETTIQVTTVTEDVDYPEEQEEEFEDAMDLAVDHRSLGAIRKECQQCVPSSNRISCETGLQCVELSGAAGRTKGNLPGCGRKPVGKSYCVKTEDNPSGGGGNTDKPKKLLKRCQVGCKKAKDCKPGLRCGKFSKLDHVPGCGYGTELKLPGDKTKKGTRVLTGVCHVPLVSPTASPTATPTKDVSFAADAAANHKHANKDGMVCRRSHQCHPGSVCDAGTDPEQPRCRKGRRKELRFVSARYGPMGRFREGYRTGNGSEVLDSVGNLRHCEADCDNDWDCAWGHVCIRRRSDNRDMGLFGCTGQGTVGEDYCVDTRLFETPNGLPPLVLWRNDGEVKRIGGDGSDELLGECEGDCDDDSMCQGDLICMFRDYEDDVSLQANGKPYPAARVFAEDDPVTWTKNGKSRGCWGRGEHDVDYCINRQWLGELREAARQAAK